MAIASSEPLWERSNRLSFHRKPLQVSAVWWLLLGQDRLPNDCSWRQLQNDNFGFAGRLRKRENRRNHDLCGSARSGGDERLLKCGLRSAEGAVQGAECSLRTAERCLRAVEGRFGTVECSAFGPTERSGLAGKGCLRTAEGASDGNAGRHGSLKGCLRPAKGSWRCNVRGVGSNHSFGRICFHDQGRGCRGCGDGGDERGEK